MPQPKKPVRTKEELEADINNQMEVNRKREKAKNELYPLLLSSSKSIEDAKLFCQAITVAMKQGFNKRMTTMRVDELGLVDMLDPSTEQYEKYKQVLDMFATESLQDAISLIEGMAYAIEGFQKEEASKRQLSELKTDFL